jgi:hypothetical protein
MNCKTINSRKLTGTSCKFAESGGGMKLKLYHIDSTLFHPNNMAIVKDRSSHKELFRFFKMNQGEEESIKKINMEFVSDKGYTLKNIEKTDYIFTFSAPLFSKKFVDHAGGILKDEMKFFPCKLICRGVALDWYAAQVIHLFPIVDKKLSTYDLSSGDVASEIIKYRKDIEEKFYTARDSEIITEFVVTELFKMLCEENNLLINIKDPLDR